MTMPTFSEIERHLEIEYPNRFSTVVVRFDLGGIGCARTSEGMFATLQRAKQRGDHCLPPSRPMWNMRGMPTSDSCDYFFVIDNTSHETCFSQALIMELPNGKWAQP